jgi:hypothetical protein
MYWCNDYHASALLNQLSRPLPQQGESGFFALSRLNSLERLLMFQKVCFFFFFFSFAFLSVE